MLKVIVIWIFVFISIVICAVLKKRLNLISAFFITLSITVFACFAPNGKILFSAGSFIVTKGAVESGLFKSGILLLLQYFSRIFVSSKIKFPGKAGAFINDVFSIYEKLTRDRKEFLKINSTQETNSTKKPLKNLISRIDERLFEVFDI